MPPRHPERSEGSPGSAFARLATVRAMPQLRPARRPTRYRGPARVVLALAALLLAALATPARGAELDIAGVDVMGAQVAVTFHLEGAFDEVFQARLDSGLPTGFVYRFELQRDRKHWWDDKLRETTLEVVAMYNAVGQDYLVNFKHDGRLIESRLVRSRSELGAALTKFDRVRLFDVAGLPRRTRLLVKGRAEMGTRTLLSFIPILLNTEWDDSRKFRVP